MNEMNKRNIMFEFEMLVDVRINEKLFIIMKIVPND